MAIEYFDVLIVGAGLSGIGAAYHLQQKCPGKTFAILEGRSAIGGTWELFRYPGIRSDSDMHTLGYKFKPWINDKAIADGPAILQYVNEVATENGIDKQIRFNHKVESAEWSSTQAQWLVTATNTDTRETVQLSCNFLYMCAGYYSYEAGYNPDFPGRETFGGKIVHPQFWPANLDYTDKNVVVIGSGATAITLVPAMAQHAKKVVMLQRTPTYVYSLPEKDRLANFMRKILPASWAYAITRWKNVTFQQRTYRLSRTKPAWVKTRILDRIRKELGPDYPVDTNFAPNYNPWDQRLCVVPDGDLFKSINSGKAVVVTDHIDTFTPTGIRLKSGKTLDADIIVTATGLNMVVLGGAKFTVDGKLIDFSKAWTYKGLMTSDVPNMVSTFGYINASWTLRADLTAELVCGLINHMDQTGTRQVTPRLHEQDRNMKPRPWIEHFSAGYMQRMLPEFPKQGDHAPWLNTQNYKLDKHLFRQDLQQDDALIFSNSN